MAKARALGGFSHGVMLTCQAGAEHDHVAGVFDGQHSAGRNLELERNGRTDRCPMSCFRVASASESHSESLGYRNQRCPKLDARHRERAR